MPNRTPSECGQPAGATHDDRHVPAGLFECVRTFWVMIGPRNIPITCALYRTLRGLEVRAGHGEQDALLRQTVFTSLTAETLAETWRAAAKAQGFQPFEG